MGLIHIFQTSVSEADSMRANFATYETIVRIYLFEFADQVIEIGFRFTRKGLEMHRHRE